MLGRLASWSARRRRMVVAGWVLLLIVLTGVSKVAGGEWRTDYRTPGSGSAAVQDLLAERFPEQSGDVAYLVFSGELSRPDVAERVSGVHAQVASLPHVRALQPMPASPDGRTAMTSVQLDDDAEQLPAEAIHRVIDTARAAGGNGLVVEAGGWPVQVVESAEAGSEGVGMVAALLILLVAFGSVIAAGLPLVVAIPALGVSFAMAALLANLIQVPDWGLTLATMIGMGVGIDYALFIVTRYRGALHAGERPEQAVVTALTTAGRAVIFAGGTVVISLLGLGTMGLEYLWGTALACSLTVLAVLAASVTLLPALLGFAGRSIDRLRVPGIKASAEGTGLWARWGHVVQRRPLLTGTVSLAILLTLAAPVTSLRFGFPDAGSGAESLTSRRAYDLVAESFGPGANGPLVLAARLTGPADQRPVVLDRLATEVAKVEGVASVAPPVVNATGDAAVVDVVPTSGPQDEGTEDLIHRLRDDVVPAAVAGTGAEVFIGGPTAAAVDDSDYSGSRIPLFIGAVVALSFLLLLVVFRAPLVALKAAIMNLLAIGAAFGVITVAVQGGWLGQLIGIEAPAPIPVFVPILMFAMLFGLSMDYEVFLLSRIREEYDRTGDNRSAVAEGIARTGRVITAAAAIMVTVFAAFVLEDQVMLKIAGLGLATAVFVDATLVRMVLVPATMELLDKRNWWLPRWLDRILPRLDVEGRSRETADEQPEKELVAA